MTTPQEIIKKFEKIVEGIDKNETEADYAWWENSVGAKFGIKKKLELKTLLISTVIKQYEEVLGKIKNLEKPICRCMCEKNKITLAYNDCVFDTFSIIESKIREWKLIYEK